MTSLLNLLPNAVGQGEPPIVYAEVVAPAPQSFSDPLYVVEPDWSRDFSFAIPNWPACHGNTLPLPGNVVTLNIDSHGTRKVVSWEGQMTYATQQSQAYYLTTTASDVAGHKKVTSQPFSPKTTVPSTNISSSQLLLDYMSPINSPGTTYLPAGQFEFHIHATQTAGNQTVQLYAEFWEYDPIGATHIARIGTSQTSLPLTFAEIEYRLFFITSNVYNFVSPASRLAVHVYALVGGSGGASASYFVGGTADSHVIIPCNSSPLTSSAWITPTLINSWTGLGSVAYLKDPLGFVHLRGNINIGASGTVAFTLPPGFRIGVTDFFPLLQSGGVAGSYVRIGTDGTIAPTYTGGPVYLNGITFLAEN